MKKILLVLFLLVLLLTSCCQRQLQPIEITKEDYLPASKILKTGQTIDIHLKLKRSDVLEYLCGFSINDDKAEWSFDDFEITKIKGINYDINSKRIFFDMEYLNNVYEVYFTLKPKKSGTYKFRLYVNGKADNIGAFFSYPDSVSYEKKLEFIVTE